MQPYNSHQWLNIATAGIVSPKERESARQELSDHMEDHAEALMAAGLPSGQAQQQAVCAMGDPAEVGKRLRKAHQPILTRLLQIAKWTAVVLLAATLWSTFLASNWIPRLGWVQQMIPEKPVEDVEDLLRIYGGAADWAAAVCPDEQVQAGDYTVSFRYVTATWVADSSAFTLNVELLFTPRFFWQEDAQPQPLFVLRDSSGQIWSSSEQMATAVRTVTFPGDRRVCITAYLDDFPENGQLELDYVGAEHRFTLPMDLKGGLVYEP